MWVRSSNVRSLDVVNLWQSSGRSACCRAQISTIQDEPKRKREKQESVIEIKNEGQRGRRERNSNAAAVVLDLKQLEPSILDRHPDVLGPGVERVLEELLEGVGRTLDDLARV